MKRLFAGLAALALVGSVAQAQASTYTRMVPATKWTVDSTLFGVSSDSSGKRLTRAMTLLNQRKFLSAGAFDSLTSTGRVNGSVFNASAVSGQVFGAILGTTGTLYTKFTNTSGDGLFGLSGSSTTGILTGGHAYALTVNSGNSSARPIDWGQNFARIGGFDSLGTLDHGRDSLHTGTALVFPGTDSVIGAPTWASGQSFPTVTSAGAVTVNGGTSARRTITYSATNGLWIAGGGGSSFDMALTDSAGNGYILVPHGLQTIRMPTYGAGTATFSSNGTISSASDETLKDIDGTFDVGLDALRRITPIRYFWNEKSGMADGHEYAGFGARAVDAVLPIATGRNANGTYTLQDRALIAVLWNSVRQLDAENETHKRELRCLAKAVNKKQRLACLN